MKARAATSTVQRLKQINYSVTILRKPVPESLVPAAPQQPSVPPKNRLLVRVRRIVVVRDVKLKRHQFPLRNRFAVRVESGFTIRTDFRYFGDHLIHHME